MPYGGNPLIGIRVAPGGDTSELQLFANYAEEMKGYTVDTHADLYALAHDLLLSHRASLAGVEDPMTLRLEVCSLAIHHGRLGGMRYYPRHTLRRPVGHPVPHVRTTLNHRRYPQWISRIRSRCSSGPTVRRRR